MEAGKPREGDLRFRPGPAPGRGPTLVCSEAASRVFAEGEPLPAPSPPVCTVSLAGAGAP